MTILTNVRPPYHIARYAVLEDVGAEDVFAPEADLLQHAAGGGVLDAVVGLDAVEGRVEGHEVVAGERAERLAKAKSAALSVFALDRGGDGGSSKARRAAPEGGSHDAIWATRRCQT